MSLSVALAPGEKVTSCPFDSHAPDGFPVVGYIDSSLWEKLSPFLMLDYITRREFLPTIHPRGVDVHPHKGFETVSIAWSGRVAHEDSSGGKGEIGPGDVQWMTAGSGILHKEFHAMVLLRRYS
jgi:redox-sensitive bicupin YhaK (pirin superfamily)